MSDSNRNTESRADFQTLTLCLGNAISFLLEEKEGIVAQGELYTHEMQKFLVWKAGGQVHINEYEGDKPAGSKFKMHDTKEDMLLSAALEGGEFDLDFWE